MKQVDMPGDFEEPIRFFGIFTVRELVGIGIPLLGSGVYAFLEANDLYSVSAALVGVAVAAAWYVYRPGGYTVEQHLYHRLRWTVRRWFL